MATGGRHINIRVTTLPGLQPYTHSSVAHAQAEKLKEMAHSPAQMQAYMRLSPAEKEAFLAEQVSDRLAVDEFLDSSLCQGLRQIYQPIVDDMLGPFKVPYVQHSRLPSRHLCDLTFSTVDPGSHHCSFGLTLSTVPQSWTVDFKNYQETAVQIMDQLSHEGLEPSQRSHSLCCTAELDCLLQELSGKSCLDSGSTSI